MKSIEFPTFPPVSAKWCPISIEPVVGSGERFTVAIAAWQISGRAAVARIVSSPKLKCMFGAKSAAVADLIDLLVDQIDGHLQKSRSLDGWKPPFTGVFVGGVSDAAAEDFDSVFKQAIAFTSSLSEASSGALLLSEIEETETQQHGLRWHSAVRAAVIIKQPALELSFNRQVKPRADAAPIRLGFYNGKYAANFGLIVPGNFSTSVKFSKASIWDLELMRHTDALFPPDKLDFIVGTPAYEDPTISPLSLARVIEIYKLIEAQAKEQRIDVFRAETATSAAERILRSASE